jgi:hypothetical protein
MTERPIQPELVERVDDRRRNLLKVVLGGMAAYTTPLMASFSMEGLRIGPVEPGVAGPGFRQFVSNQGQGGNQNQGQGGNQNQGQGGNQDQGGA